MLSKNIKIASAALATGVVAALLIGWMLHFLSGDVWLSVTVAAFMGCIYGVCSSVTYSGG